MHGQQEIALDDPLDFNVFQNHRHDTTSTSFNSCASLSSRSTPGSRRDSVDQYLSQWVTAQLALENSSEVKPGDQRPPRHSWHPGPIAMTPGMATALSSKDVSEATVLSGPEVGPHTITSAPHAGPLLRSASSVFYSNWYLGNHHPQLKHATSYQTSLPNLFAPQYMALHSTNDVYQDVETFDQEDVEAECFESFQPCFDFLDYDSMETTRSPTVRQGREEETSELASTLSRSWSSPPNVNTKAMGHPPCLSAHMRPPTLLPSSLGHPSSRTAFAHSRFGHNSSSCSLATNSDRQPMVSSSRSSASSDSAKGLLSHPQGTTAKGSSQRLSVHDIDITRLNEIPFGDLEEHLVDLCKDQQGCRFLQCKIDELVDQSPELCMIHDRLDPYFVDLMTDPFGNYICQRLLERCDQTRLTRLVVKVLPRLVETCFDMHGTRVIQKLIDHVSTQSEIEAITSTLAPHAMSLIEDLNGNHVIQKCLNRLSARHNAFIYVAVCNDCVPIATHKYGCCVVQRCITFANEAQRIDLIKHITKHSLDLVKDPYGNYVIQFVLGYGKSDYTTALVHQFLDHTRDLSMQKFSSNVIEKCMRAALSEPRRLLIEKILEPETLPVLARDSFANYVVQTALDYAEMDQYNKLVQGVLPILTEIRFTPHGKRIHAKIHRGQGHHQQTRHRRGKEPLSTMNVKRQEDSALNRTWAHSHMTAGKHGQQRGGFQR